VEGHITMAAISETDLVEDTTGEAALADADKKK
jgi:hypothetical protein